jgi:hypothetical protein
VEARNQSKLVREVAELVQLLQQEVANGDSVLDELTESAVKSVPSARYAGVTVAAREHSANGVVERPLPEQATRF